MRENLCYLDLYLKKCKCINVDFVFRSFDSGSSNGFRLKLKDIKNVVIDWEEGKKKTIKEELLDIEGRIEEVFFSNTSNIFATINQC